MTQRLYKHYPIIRTYINKGVLPKTKPSTLAIADIFYNLRQTELIQKALENKNKIATLTSKNEDWKVRRKILQDERLLCREVLGRLLKPKPKSISKQKITKYKKKNDTNA